MLLINNKPSYSPKSLCAAFGGKPSLFATVVDTRKALLGAVLVLPYWLSFRVDKDPMRASPLDEFSLLSVVPHTSLPWNGVSCSWARSNADENACTNIGRRCG